MKAIRIECDTKLNIPLKDLIPCQGNLKEMDKASAKKLAKSIMEDGIDFSFTVWRDKEAKKWYLIDGHGRDKIIKFLVDKEGWTCPPIPCVETFAKTLKQAKKKVLRSSSTYHKITKQGLYEFVEEMGMEADDIDEYELPDLNANEWKDEYYNDPAEVEGQDEVPELPKKPKAKLGDLYLLGEHRILCGDSTQKKDIGKLMDEKKADMVFTDPPYGGNVGGLKSYTGAAAKIRKKQGKSLVYQSTVIENDAEIEWLGDVFPILPIKNNATKVVFFKWDKWEDIRRFSKDWGRPTALLVWDRVRRANNFFRFQPQHELAFHWGNQADKREKSSLSNVFHIEKDEKEIHPTVKPIALLEPILRVCSSLNELILDPFLGSGSTLIACEKTKRKCYGMELDPAYCDVIIQRFIEFSKKPVFKLDGSKKIDVTQLYLPKK